MKKENKHLQKSCNNIKHEFNVNVYPADTDSYGVGWHGAYFKWLERGRIDVLEKMGISFLEMDRMGILVPVVNIDIKYKRFARPYDSLVIESLVEEFNKTSMIFRQEIKNVKTGELILTAMVKGVTTNKEGKLFRKIPDYLQEKLKVFG